MPASSYLPAKNAALAQRLSNFVTVANANMPALKLTPYDLVNIQTAAQQFHADMTSAEAAKQAAISAVHSKKTSRANGGDPVTVSAASAARRLACRARKPLCMPNSLSGV